MTTNNTKTVRLHSVLRATPERVYRAFLDANRDGQVASTEWIHGQGPPAIGFRRS